MAVSSLLPVLQSQAAPMSLCAICPEPGHCCKKFSLQGAFLFEDWQADLEEVLRVGGVPFFRLHSLGPIVRDDIDGQDYVSVFLSCTNVSENGRCGIYESRPALCRKYVPTTDGLCVFAKGATN